MLYQLSYSRGLLVDWRFIQVSGKENDAEIFDLKSYESMQTRKDAVEVCRLSPNDLSQ
jgi:hypothetical protein